MHLPCKTDRLLSLWELLCWIDMEPFKAATFYKIGRLLERIAAVHGARWKPGSAFFAEAAFVDNLDNPISAKEKELLSPIIISIHAQCDKIKLVRATEYAADILKQVKERDELTNRQVANLLTELDKHIRWDMEKETFMYVPGDRAPYYHNKSLLSLDAVTNFPSSAQEMEQAGDCYAAGCWTASVMHSMRSLEKPIHSIAGAIGGINLSKEIELATWGEISREIDNKVKGLRNTKHTTLRDDDLAFYSTLNLEFGYFNDTWRKFAAHSRKTYDEPQAKSALQHVCAFIDEAAKKGLQE